MGGGEGRALKLNKKRTKILFLGVAHAPCCVLASFATSLLALAGMPACMCCYHGLQQQHSCSVVQARSDTTGCLVCCSPICLQEWGGAQAPAGCCGAVAQAVRIYCSQRRRLGQPLCAAGGPAGKGLLGGVGLLLQLLFLLPLLPLLPLLLLLPLPLPLPLPLLLLKLPLLLLLLLLKLPLLVLGMATQGCCGTVDQPDLLLLPAAFCCTPCSLPVGDDAHLRRPEAPRGLQHPRLAGGGAGGGQHPLCCEARGAVPGDECRGDHAGAGAIVGVLLCVGLVLLEARGSSGVARWQGLPLLLVPRRNCLRCLPCGAGAAPAASDASRPGS